MTQLFASLLISRYVDLLINSVLPTIMTVIEVPRPMIIQRINKRSNLQLKEETIIFDLSSDRYISFLKD